MPKYYNQNPSTKSIKPTFDTIKPVPSGNQSTQFINPYTFIPLGTNAPVRKAQEKGDNSGYIECTLTVREGSPLFIPNTTKTFGDSIVRNNAAKSNVQDTHKHKVFYSYDDLSDEANLSERIRMPEKPVIPGSELRGMLRNIYEQLTNSCMIHVDERNLPYKRTNEPKVMFLMKYNTVSNKWYLYNTNQFANWPGTVEFDNDSGTFYLNGSWAGLSERAIADYYQDAYNRFAYGKNNKVTCISAANWQFKPDNNGDYFIHLPTIMPGKTPKGKHTANRVVIYSDETNGDGIEVSTDTLNRFKNVIGASDVKGSYTSSVNNNKDSKRLMIEYVAHFKNHDPLIVYVDKGAVEKKFKNCIVYLAPASMTKEFFDNEIKKLLVKNDQHQACDNKDSICPACRLFGMVGKEGTTAGKLRFADGLASTKPIYGNERVLPILGSPKISSTEFYLQRPVDNARLWNYDYYVSNIQTIKNEQVYTRKNDISVRISGRKVYWNSNAPASNVPKSNMNCSVTPIVQGAFKFKIFFDHLTKEELEKLLFCIKLDEKSYHKIGGGKPIGMGQVKLSVVSVQCFDYSLVDGMIKKSQKGYSSDIAEAQKIRATQEAKNIIKYSSDLPESDKALIAYPSNLGSGDIFKWFSKNRGSVSAPKIQQTLPKITDSNQKLKKY